jgi:hypothetical protein
MDCRDTISKDQTFLKMLREEHEAGRKVNLIIDANGLNRLQGHIVSMRENELELEGKVVVPLSEIIAINGIFSSDFSEC